MKHTLTIFVSLLSLTCFCQTDQSGNPVFNSVPMGEDTVGGCKLFMDPGGNMIGLITKG